MECMELKICMNDKHHRYYKHTKFRQNPRGDPKFLVDLTRNDPYNSIKNAGKIWGWSITPFSLMFKLQIVLNFLAGCYIRVFLFNVTALLE